MKKFFLRFFTVLFVIIIVGFLIPEPRAIPVHNATSADWNHNTFWFEPWGSSGVHKGVDIFAKPATAVIAPTNIIILYRGTIKKGGNIIVGLGPKWRFHYFAHLESINDASGLFVEINDVIGLVGDTGNAKGKQPHLHYSIVSLIPMPWLIDESSQGYKKAFYLDPIKFMSE